MLLGVGSFFVLLVAAQIHYAQKPEYSHLSTSLFRYYTKCLCVYEGRLCINSVIRMIVRAQRVRVCFSWHTDLFVG